jgi:hypothetical protein
MKKVLGIVLLVLALSLVSVPALAQQVELNLKLWHPGVVGADEWVADYGTYDFEAIELRGVSVLQWEPPPHKDENELVLRPGSGLSFILSGEYFILPSISVGGSYWGLSRADEVGVELENNYMSFPYSATTTLNGEPKWYWIKLPWFEEEVPVWGQEAVLGGKETLSMSALDVHVTKTFCGSGWEAGLSGGVRRAAFNEHLSTELDLIAEYEYEADEESYREWWGHKDHYDLGSKVSMSAIGPQVGIKGIYALADKLVLKAGAKAGLLFGTAQTDATFTREFWGYDYTEEIPNNAGFHVAPAQAEEIPYEWELLFSDEAPPHKATDTIRITTFDLSAALAYQITEQLSVEAGYYASIWKGVPSLFQFSVDEYMGPAIAEDNGDSDPSLWEQPEARDVIVGGLTLGVNFKF